ncbi:MAG: 1,4-dihydroxy-2-naphthoate octaprenyltransferase [Bacteroidota bacterium]
MSVGVWIKAARLRTLPLAIAGIVSGNWMAYVETGHINKSILGWSLLTAVLLQVLSNFANDYGDFVNGADTDERTDRMMASGKISIAQMKQAILILIIGTLISGITLLGIGIGFFSFTFFIMLLLGIGGILAAYFYTAGKNPYGYIGLGDVSVFLFFGYLAVGGTYYLQTTTLTSPVWWVATAIGCLSVGVLNVNNMRDISSDSSKNKITVAVKLGFKNAWFYQLFLICTAVACFLMYVYCNSIHATQFMFLIFTPLLIKHLQQLKKAEGKERVVFNQQLKMLSLLTLMISIAFCFSQAIVN